MIRSLRSGMARLRAGRQRSSVSDGTDYVALCERAAGGGAAFEDFRSDPSYREILEHVTPEQGMAYLEHIEADPEVARQLAALVGGDDVGRPLRFPIGRLPSVSPTTLRYVKVMTDLRRLFGPLDGLAIAEIGIGYGGQARILTSFHAITRYALFDLPPVLALAQRFLREFPATSTELSFHDGRQVEPVDSDLLISNYAFSELRREVQESYLEHVIAGAPRGYVTYNHITPPSFGTLSAQQFADRIPGAELLPEVPLTHRDNVVVVWGHHDATART